MKKFLIKFILLFLIGLSMTSCQLPSYFSVSGWFFTLNYESLIFPNPDWRIEHILIGANELVFSLSLRDAQIKLSEGKNLDFLNGKKVKVFATIRPSRLLLVHTISLAEPIQTAPETTLEGWFISSWNYGHEFWLANGTDSLQKLRLSKPALEFGSPESFEGQRMRIKAFVMTTRPERLWVHTMEPLNSSESLQQIILTGWMTKIYRDDFLDSTAETEYWLHDQKSKNYLLLFDLNELTKYPSRVDTILNKRVKIVADVLTSKYRNVLKVRHIELDG